MKTRTLMLLALASGLAIMIAGAVFFVQLTTQDDPPEPIDIGTAVQVGDMNVTVVDIDEADSILNVTVRIGGVDDPDGGSGFRLIASGRPLTVDADEPGLCGATSSEEQTCVLRFDVSTADGSSRVLFYERGDEQARWVLA